jgi:hypothetical protein
MTGGKHIAVFLQPISGVSAINPLRHPWRKERGAILLFCPGHNTRLKREINMFMYEVRRELSIGYTSMQSLLCKGYCQYAKFQLVYITIDVLQMFVKKLFPHLEMYCVCRQVSPSFRQILRYKYLGPSYFRPKIASH